MKSDVLVLPIPKRLIASLRRFVLCRELIGVFNGLALLESMLFTLLPSGVHCFPVESFAGECGCLSSFGVMVAGADLSCHLCNS